MMMFHLVLLGIISTCVILVEAGEDRCTLVPNLERVDCHPDGIVDKDACVARGCCWSPESWPPRDPNEPGVPPCFYSYDFVNYDVTHSIISESKMIMLLKRRPIATGFSNNIDSLLVEVDGLTNNTLRIRITDSQSKRFEVPEHLLNIGLMKATCSANDILYTVNYEVEKLAGPLLVVRRRSNNVIIFALSLKRIIYADQYIAVHLDTLPSPFLYGLGEHYEDFRVDFKNTYKRLVFWNRPDSPQRHMPAYGSHPFYLMKEAEDSPLAHGVLFFNHNMADVTLRPSQSLVYRAIGGIIDMFVFLGTDSYDVISTKNRLIGLPTMPPLWSLGFHLSRHGYKTTAHMNETLRRNQAAGIPVDVQWVDIDYMNRGNDFTIDDENFGNLGQFVRQIHTEGLHFVPIIDPAVSADEREGTYAPYDFGKMLDIFVKQPQSTEDFVGRLYNPVSSVFPDFTNPLTDLYWSELLRNLSTQMPFDGLWIDANEPANSIDGALKVGCSKTSFDYPQYDPTAKNGTFIFKSTICMTSQHYLGSHYNLHNMYSLYEAMRTWNALETLNPRKRHFILSRATVTGQARYSFHWTGNIYSTWQDLRQSIHDIQSFNIHGIPMVGADVCGFKGAVNAELCARWSSLGAFYPFSRNHNEYDNPDQDPAALGPDVIAAAKNALNIRYQLIPYMYTLLYQASVDGVPMIRSLALEYPTDVAAGAVVNQFLLGSNIMISPVVDPNVTQVTPYFPVATGWNDFVSLKPLLAPEVPDRRLTIPCNISEISVSIKQGSIVPTFTSPRENLMKTVRESGYTLYVSPDSTEGEATGHLFIDSGDEPIDSPFAKNSYIQMKVTRYNETKYTLTSQPLKNLYKPGEGQANLKVDRIIVLNSLNTNENIVRRATLTSIGSEKPIEMVHDQQSNSVTLMNINQDINQAWTVTWDA